MKGMLKEYRDRAYNFKRAIELRGLSDYIMGTFPGDEQNQILECLQNPELQAHIDLRIYFTKRDAAYEDKSGGEK